MKSTEQVKDLRTKSVDELQNIVGSSQQELMNLRFRLASGQLKQTAQINAVKKTVARAKTILTEKETKQ